MLLLSLWWLTWNLFTGKNRFRNFNERNDTHHVCPTKIWVDHWLELKVVVSALSTIHAHATSIHYVLYLWRPKSRYSRHFGQNIETYRWNSERSIFEHLITVTQTSRDFMKLLQSSKNLMIFRIDRVSSVTHWILSNMCQYQCPLFNTVLRLTSGLYTVKKTKQRMFCPIDHPSYLAYVGVKTSQKLLHLAPRSKCTDVSGEWVWFADPPMQVKVHRRIWSVSVICRPNNAGNSYFECVCWHSRI